MTTSPLWFVLAGFLLGFVTSTLWEWFHFRKERMRRVETATRAPVTSARPRVAPVADEARPVTDVTRTPAVSGYRSPGVFLESEETAHAEESADELLPPDDEPLPPPTIATVAGSRAGSPPSRRRQEVLAALRRTSEVGAGKSEAEAPAKTRRDERAVSVEVAADTLPAWRKDPSLTRPSSGHPDDLSKVKGIGDVYRQRLFRAGIFTWRQIVEAELDTLRQATGAYPSSNVEEWPVQARALMARFGRENAVYEGPPPDELTKILGIGPVSAQTLYKAGICTYEQLASATVPTLAALFPIAVAGDQPDFAAWIVQAGRLADQKHRT